MHRRENLICIILAFILIFNSGCANGKETPEKVSRSDFLMDTVVTITLYDGSDEEILDECFELMHKYEQMFSRTDETSEIARLNAGEISEVSEETAELIQKGLYYSALSDGAFDITICPVSKLWNFTNGGTIPSEESISVAVKHVGYEKVKVDGCEILFLQQGVEIDLGGIAKGYVADRLRDLLLERGVESALINLGGNTLCVGRKPDGSAFRVGVQTPFGDQNDISVILSVEDLSVVTSGVYERCFEVNGKLYHHILNPKTGYPYDNSLLSVTIICENSADADALSTTCFALGLEEGLAFINKLECCYAVFITDEYEIIYSDGAQAFVTE